MLIEFETIHDYLAGLELISRQLSAQNMKSITYLAAAVSDFYIPLERVHEHKIQGISAETGFSLEMEAVPKMMGQIKQEWNPSTVLVSFKLETDQEILANKALAAMKQYGVDMVVANELKTRRSQVIIYSQDQTAEILVCED